MSFKRVLLIVALVSMGVVIGCSDHFGNGRTSRNSANQPPPPPILSFFPFPGGTPFMATVGAPFSQNITVTGGLPPYTWTVSGGALPPGIALATTTVATNQLAGTPMAVGSFTFQIDVQTSGTPPSGTVTYTIQVN